MQPTPAISPSLSAPNLHNKCPFEQSERQLVGLGSKRKPAHPAWAKSSGRADCERLITCIRPVAASVCLRVSQVMIDLLSGLQMGAGRPTCPGRRRPAGVAAFRGLRGEGAARWPGGQFALFTATARPLGGNPHLTNPQSARPLAVRAI